MADKTILTNNRSIQSGDHLLSEGGSCFATLDDAGNLAISRGSPGHELERVWESFSTQYEPRTQPCEAERATLRSLELSLENLRDELRSAPASAKPGLLREISALQPEVALARRKLDQCLATAPTQPVRKTGVYRLTLYDDARLAIIDSTMATVWSSGVTCERGRYYVLVSEEGRLEVYAGSDTSDRSELVWRSSVQALESPAWLNVGEILVSANQRYHLVLSPTGNMAVFRGPSPDHAMGRVWQSHSVQYLPDACKAERAQVAQLDRQLELLEDELRDASSSTKPELLRQVRELRAIRSDAVEALARCQAAHPRHQPREGRYACVMQNDANLVIYDEESRHLWDSHVTREPGDYHCRILDTGDLLVAKGRATDPIDGLDCFVWSNGAKVTGFIPSRNGWPFGNPWGYCGGMCWSALRHFERGSLLGGPLQPAPDSGPHYDEIYAQQCASLDATPEAIRAIVAPVVGGGVMWYKVFTWHTILPDESNFTFDSIGVHTRKDWYDVIKPRLDARQPVTLVLILGDGLNWTIDHQVLAIGYYPVPQTKNDEYCISIYDPNSPLDDDVYIRVAFGGGDDIGAHTCGGNRHYWDARKRIRGFFGNPLR